MSTTNLEFTDRYAALGIATSDVKTMCDGDCEGTGMVPIREDDPDRHNAYKEAWDKAEAENPNAPDDKWHLVLCKDCGGSGKNHPPSP